MGELFIEQLVKYLIIGGIFFLLPVLGRLVKGFLLGGDAALPQPAPVVPGHETQQRAEEKEQAMDIELLDDIRHLGMYREEQEKMQRQAPYLARNKENMPPVAISSKVTVPKRGSTLRRKLHKDIHQADTLRRAFLMGEIIKPKHGF